MYCVYLDRTGYSAGVQWLAGSLLLLGIMAQSGGFFIHLGLGQKNRSSLGTIVTRTGALLLGAALIVLAISTGGVWWFYWPLLGWGIGSGAHALGVFGFGGGGTGRNARLGR